MSSDPIPPGATPDADRARLAAILDSLSEGVVACDAEGNVLFVNRANRELHDVDGVEAIPRAEWTTRYALFEVDGVTPFPIERLPLVRVLHGEECPVEELIIVTATRGPRRFVARGRPVRSADGTLLGGVVSTTDVTEEYETHQRLRAQAEALRESEERFRGAFRHSAIGFAIVGLGGDWIDVNAALCHIVGYSRDELLQRSFQDITHPDDLALDLAFVRSLIAGEADNYRLEKRYLHREGRVVWIHLTVSIVRDARSAPLYFISQIEDISDRRASEERLRHAAKMDAVAGLAGGIAHDFNNLLAVVRASAEFILEETPSSSPVHADARTIERATQRAESLTRQLLSFARRHVRQTTSIDAARFLREVEPALARLVAPHQRFVLRPITADVEIQADAAELRVALANLVENARDAMPEGGIVTVSCWTRMVDAAFTAQHPGLVPGRYACFTVQDTGPGLSEDARAHLFEPFFSTKAAGHRAGLGLATVYAIMRDAGGTVTFDTPAAGGARFTLWLPEMSSARPSPPAGVPSLTDLANARECAVLVVDDDDSVREVLVRVLERAGFTVHAAPSGVAALALLNAHPDIEVLLTDFAMPGMDGRELLERTHARYPGVRTILMSGYTADEEIRRTLQETDTLFLAKPFSVPTLVQTVQSLVGVQA